MAFISKGSKYLIQYKFGKFSNHTRQLKHLSHPKVAYLVISSPLNAHHFSTVSNDNNLISTLNANTAALPRFNLSSWHHFSTDGHKENLEVILSDVATTQSSLEDSAIETSANKVLFVETPPVVESSEVLTDSIASTYISDLPLIPVEVVEPTLASLGLVHWTPVGLVEACLEYLHISMCMPWWVAIVTATVIARALMFPIVIKTQQNAARMSNYMPQMQFLQAKFAEARRTGNVHEASKCANELMVYMNKHHVNPMKTMMIPMLQAPVFISYFLGLRSMAKLPVESMKIGGFSWITDLTIPDPYFIMPLMACSTLYVILKVGAESGVRMENMKFSRYVLTAIPFIAFPFCMNFPSAVLFYWCTNNALTLAVVTLLKVENIREYFNIPKRQETEPQFLPKKKGLVQGVKDAFDDQRVIKLIEERKKMDEVRFQKAGTGPIPRTYAYDPTKPRPASAAAAAAAAIRQKQTKI